MIPEEFCGERRGEGGGGKRDTRGVDYYGLLCFRHVLVGGKRLEVQSSSVESSGQTTFSRGGRMHPHERARRACTWGEEMESSRRGLWKNSSPQHCFVFCFFASRRIKCQRWFDRTGAAQQITPVVYYLVVNQATRQQRINRQNCRNFFF